MAVTGLTDVEDSGPGAMGASAPERFVPHCHSRLMVGAKPCGAQQGFAERHRIGIVRQVLQRTQERHQVGLFLRRELHGETDAVKVDHPLERSCRAVMEIRRTRGQPSKDRSFDLADVRPFSRD